MPISDFGQADINATLAAVRNFAGSVGCISVQLSDGSWVKVGTAFRVPGGARRMVTARHVLGPIMNPQVTISAAHPFQFTGTLRPTAVSFDDDADDKTFRIEKILWAHPKWDLMVFDLYDDPNRPELDIHTELDWGEDGGNPVCIISYPTIPSTLDMPMAGTVIGTPLGVKRVSIGLANRNTETPAIARVAPAYRFADEHDATTLPGSSGAAVIDLRSGRVVGVHIHGRALHASLPFNSNFAVNLPIALAELPLKQAICDPALALGNDVPIAWRPDLPAISGLNEVALGMDPGGLESIFPDARSPALANIIADTPDFRDLIYRPSLGVARDGILPKPEELPPPGDQLGEPSCAGFALATAIHIDLMRAGRDQKVSERMLYEMARLHDEWVDDEVGGTSIRGAIKGFYHNGVCTAKTARYLPGQTNWVFSIDAAKEARNTTLGSYYRLRPSITDFQSAIAECGAIVVSAHVHSGWIRPKSRPVRRIPFRKGRIGTHAFVIVGYDSEGFVIQNSWGAGWSDFEKRPGLAHWSYSDWGENLIDAWVLRLAASAPSAFYVVAKVRRDKAKDGELEPAVAHLPVPRRSKLVGHVAQAERDEVVGAGRTGVSLETLRETALCLGSAKAKKKYPHIAFFLHDPFLGRETLSRLCGHLIDPLKKAGIYPIHIVYGMDEIQTLQLRIAHEAEAAKARMVGSGQDIDTYLELRAKQTCARLLTSFAEGAVTAAKEGGALWQIATSILIETGGKHPCTLVSMGCGSLVADALQRLERWDGLEAFPARDLRLAPVSPAPNMDKGDVQWSLPGSGRANSILGGYRGDWHDLARSIRNSIGEDELNDKPLRGTGANLAEAIASEQFLSAVKRGIRANPPKSKAEVS